MRSDRFVRREQTADGNKSKVKTTLSYLRVYCTLDRRYSRDFYVINDESGDNARKCTDSNEDTSPRLLSQSERTRRLIGFFIFKQRAHIVSWYHARGIIQREYAWRGNFKVKIKFKRRARKRTLFNANYGCIPNMVVAVEQRRQFSKWGLTEVKNSNNTLRICMHHARVHYEYLSLIIVDGVYYLRVIIDHKCWPRSAFNGFINRIATVLRHDGREIIFTEYPHSNDYYIKTTILFRESDFITRVTL